MLRRLALAERVVTDVPITSDLCRGVCNSLVNAITDMMDDSIVQRVLLAGFSSVQFFTFCSLLTVL
jgi:hypothetical protein